MPITQSTDEDVASLFRPAVQSMQAYVPGEQPQAGKFLKLNTNENPYPPPQAVITAITEAAQGRWSAIPIRSARPFEFKPQRY